MSNVSRRSFIKTATVASAAATAMAAPAPAAVKGSNDRIRIGFIGPGGRGFSAHVKNLAKLHKEGANIELAAVSEVYQHQEDKVCDYIQEETGTKAKRYPDYRDMLADKRIDAVCIGTPDHWHARQTLDALAAGKHVFCEKPMTKKIEEAVSVVDAWRASGLVMQVGVQSTSLPVWDQARKLIEAGKVGKVLGYQTEYFRNSNLGQWRYYPITEDMSPKTINWRRWLGVDEGLGPDLPFDRAVYAQWRCYWPFGSGMYTDLFVHRTTAMLKATGLRYPGRVIGAGGIYLEYDGREVPDVATVVADYKEGCQGIITGYMSNQESRPPQLIRGHFGTLFFGNGEEFESFDFKAERPQVTLNSKIKDEKIKAERGSDENTTYDHFKNFIAAVEAEDPSMCNNPPDLGAAALITVLLGARSYREGKAFFFDADTKQVHEADSSWATRWETMSKARANPNHIPGWHAGDLGSKLQPPEYMKLAGPWINGVPPEKQES